MVIYKELRETLRGDLAAGEPSQDLGQQWCWYEQEKSTHHLTDKEQCYGWCIFLHSVEYGEAYGLSIATIVGMTQKLKKGLEDIGFIFDQSDHQKVKYYGDDRYTIIYASTPSDKGHGREK